MCGIAGWVNCKGPILRSLELISHRGPDDAGLWQVDDVVFAHRRLSIIGSKDHVQPIVRERHMFAINGEIYNYREFITPGNDSYAFFVYIIKHGLMKALSDANGMFAFSYYDGEKVYLAVDRLGQKPLYYYHEGKKLVFASTSNALLWLKNEWKINREALQSYWFLGAVMGRNSLFEGIKRLNAAELLTFCPKTGELTVEKYWEPKFQENTSGIEDLVLDAIQKVKVSDVPVYVFLSGGVDSTLVASQCEGMGAIHLDGPERKYAEQVAGKFNLNLKVVNPQEFDPVEAMTDYVSKSGEPAMSALIPWVVSREAARFGKVAISANGADELFFGYNRTREDVCSEQVKHMFRSIDTPWIGEFSFASGRRLELRDYVQFDLNATLDRASMCHSLEVRSPFLDHRLVEMALSIPEKVHRNGYGNKSILKKMLNQMGFDEPFFQRPKMGFSLFRQLNNLEKLKIEALNWAIERGFLNCDLKNVSGRDILYLQASAFSFKVWYEHHQKILRS